MLTIKHGLHMIWDKNLSRTQVYSKWQTYEAKGDDKVFPRQKKTADRLLELLGGTKCTMEDAE